MPTNVDDIELQCDVIWIPCFTVMVISNPTKQNDNIEVDQMIEKMTYLPKDKVKYYIKECRIMVVIIVEEDMEYMQNNKL